MAVSYQVAAPPGSSVLVADQTTTKGGNRVTIQNGHSSEPLFVGGEENAETINGAAGAAITVATGYKVAGAASLTVILGAGDKLYARGGGTTVTVSVMVFRTNGPPGA
jgi:hypothetical protein